MANNEDQKKEEIEKLKEKERLEKEEIKELKSKLQHKEEELKETEEKEERLEKENPEHEKKFTIIINGQRKVVVKEILSFNELVNLAYDNNPPTGPNIKFSITYRNGPRKNPAGDMIENSSIEIKDGMIFNVTPTNQS